MLLWQVPLHDKSCFNLAFSQSVWLYSVSSLEFIVYFSGEANTALLCLDAGSVRLD